MLSDKIYLSFKIVGGMILLHILTLKRLPFLVQCIEQMNSVNEPFAIHAHTKPAQAALSKNGPSKDCHCRPVLATSDCWKRSEDK